MATVPHHLERNVIVPPLRNGDRLRAEEFLRRYEATPEEIKAELIEGVVFMPSPVSSEDHGDPHFDLISWLGIYCFATPGLKGSDNATVRLDQGANVTQPDGSLRILAGQCRTGDDGYLWGAPDLVAKVAASSVSYDLHVKLKAYQRNGVREYVVWRVEDKTVDWFTSRAGEFKPLRRTADGLLKSKIFPGLWLDPNALIQGDAKRLTAVLQQRIASPEHARFVKKLQKMQAKKA
jgi:hypothetical protein